jgi:hypothetical protein
MFLAVLAFALAHSAAASPFTPVLKNPRGALAALDPHRGADFARLLDRVSLELVGRPYELGPLGEGEDAGHPLYRTDAFDCTTFLETVMANAYCFRAGADCLERRMRKIRYGGEKARFEDRNHIPELDWLPANVRRGYLEDLSASLFPGGWKEALPTIDRAAWLASKGRASPRGSAKPPPLHYIPAAYFFVKVEPAPQEKAALDGKMAAAEKEIAALRALPASEETRKEIEKKRFRADLALLRATYAPVAERLALIPSGTVLNLVRAPEKDRSRAKLTTLISHQGLVVQGARGPRLRHAAANVGHVADQSLADYLLRFVRSAHYRGIALYRILPARK